MVLIVCTVLVTITITITIANVTIHNIHKQLSRIRRSTQWQKDQYATNRKGHEVLSRGVEEQTSEHHTAPHQHDLHRRHHQRETVQTPHPTASLYLYCLAIALTSTDTARAIEMIGCEEVGQATTQHIASLQQRW